jgi:hypothetical protein
MDNHTPQGERIVPLLNSICWQYRCRLTFLDPLHSCTQIHTHTHAHAHTRIRLSIHLSIMQQLHEELKMSRYFIFLISFFSARPQSYIVSVSHNIGTNPRVPMTPFETVQVWRPMWACSRDDSCGGPHFQKFGISTPNSVLLCLVLLPRQYILAVLPRYVHARWTDTLRNVLDMCAPPGRSRRTYVRT